jgi:glycosyltransferase involved in cell wall biosynthesis
MSEGTALHVITRYQRGGSERRVQDSIRALPEYRHHLLVGADSDAELARAQTAANRVSVLPSLVRQVSPTKDVSALASLWRLLRRERYSVVVTHQSKAGVLARTAATLAGGPPAVHSLSMASFGPGYGALESGLFTRIERVLGSRTAAFCVVGEDLAARFARIGVPADRLHVVRSGIPLPAAVRPREDARALVDERHGTQAGRRLICYVGSLEPRKNTHLLPQLLRRLHDRMAEPPDLLVIGEGPQRQQLITEMAARGLAGHVVLTGYLADPSHVHDAIRASDVVVLLSEVEGLPQVLVQSAASGTPFVAFDVEGVQELLSLGARGAAVAPGRLEDAADAVERLLPHAATGAAEPTADLSSWSAEAIAASYRRVISAAVRQATTVQN